jgi:CHAT domain-containing protein
VEGTFLAIGDYSAALTVLRKETSPLEWMAAIWNRGVCYLHMMGDGYEERLKKAIADLEAALTVCTRQASPARYRRTQLFLYQAFERLGKWEEAYKAIREAIAAQRDLLATNPGESQRQDLIADVANIQVEIYVRAAEVLLHFNRPPLPEMACLLEEGRTQNLRLALSLDTLDPERISDPAARRRAERFLAARNVWQQQQNQITNWFMSSGKTTTTGVSQGQLDQQAQENHAAFVKTIEAIRKHDDPDFMAPTPTFDDILRAVSTPGTALVYLAAGAEGGLALMIMRNGKGTLQTHCVPLPQLKARTISHLLETDATKHIPIKLERSLLVLAEAGLNEVAQVLSWNAFQKVRLIPFGLLSLFPLPAVHVKLVSGEKKCLGDLFEVTIAPSARSIEIAEKRAANLDRRTHPSLLLGGDPRPRPAKVKGLPYAEAEADTVQRIAKRFGYEEKNIRYLRSAEMTKEKVIALLNRTWYAHLAVHGTYQPDNPRRSHLILARSHLILAGDKDTEERKCCIFLGEALDRRTLDGYNILNLEGLRLLILSACETAIIDVKQVPDEFIGLAAGFLQAGVAGVIASLWAVDDRATYLLMTRFAQLYLDPQNGYSPAQALARAQHWLREEATNKVLMTYDPVKGFPTNSATGQAQAGKKTRAHKESMFRNSSLRSIRYSYKAGITEIHEKSKIKSFNDPDAIPYANPVYWAAFVVTGC